MKEKKYKVLVDTDPGLGRRGKDVDDGLALLFMLKNQERFQIEGITTVFGNTAAKTGFKLLEKYLELTNNEKIPHFLGSSSKEEFGKETTASKYLIKKVQDNPGKITLLTLGPLTNVATAMKLSPQFLNNLNQVVFMGGIINPMQKVNKKLKLGDGLFESNEFNFNQDPQSAKLFIEAKTTTPRIGMGLDICSKAQFTEEHLKRFQKQNTPMVNYATPYIKNWLNIWKYITGVGFYPFDTFVPIYLIRPEFFRQTYYDLKVDITDVPGRLHISKISDGKNIFTPVSYCMDFKSPDYSQEFIEILLEGLLRVNSFFF